jgi:hypothetical protein
MDIINKNMCIVNKNGHKYCYNDEEHKYYIDDTEVPGPTKIFNDLELTNLRCVERNLLKRSQVFGTAVHLACELYDKQLLDMASLDPNLKPYLNAWQLFCQDFEPKILYNEQSVFSLECMFGGTLDKIIEIGNKIILIDLKTCTQISKLTTPLQTMCYKIAAEEFLGIKIDERWVTQLKPDIYKLYCYNKSQDEKDKKNWLSCLNVYNLKPKRRAA